MAQWELEHRAQSSTEFVKLIELNFQLFLVYWKKSKESKFSILSATQEISFDMKQSILWTPNYLQSSIAVVSPHKFIDIIKAIHLKV